jgi:ABC-type phosphate transport system substrate-binding protein
MTFLNVRRLMSVCIMVAVSSVALVTIGAATASAKKLPPPKCTGGGITGQGANAAQIAIEKVWAPDFSSASTTNKTACPSGPAVKYTKTNSGKGLESWGVFSTPLPNFGPLNAYVATEEPLSEGDKTEVEDFGGGVSSPGTALTIPVAQESIAILVHLPEGCKASSNGAKERLVLNNVTLELIFRGEIHNWGQITDDGDALTGCVTPPSEDPLTRIVRSDLAGTSHILKKYLSLINPTGEYPTESGPTLGWSAIAEGLGNTNWPRPAGSLAVLKESKEGDNQEVTEVATHAGSIGYAGLADARANAAFYPASSGGTGGPGTPTFWVPIQDSGLSTTKKLEYADPSTTGETSKEAADANCAKEKYTNGKGKTFPPSSVTDAWSPVTTETKQKNYSLCGLVYILALSKYSAYSADSSEATTKGESETLNQFLQFVTNDEGTGTAAGGQVAIENHDYEALPKKVLKESEAGALLVGD